MSRLTVRSGSCRGEGVGRGVRVRKNGTTMDVVVIAARNVALQTSVELSMTHFVVKRVVVKSVGWQGGGPVGRQCKLVSK